MKAIMKKRFIRHENGRALIRAEIVTDTSSELPVPDEFEGCRLAAGSISWAVNSGELYALNSSGEWIRQNGGE